VWLMAAFTMTVGNVIALAQRNLKRMLAYSSVAHVGYMLVGVAAGPELGSAAVLYYLLVYSLATVGAFGVILLLERDGVEAVDLEGYGGLAARHPVLTLVLTVCLLSLIGLPPTAGFVGKFYLFSAAIRAGGPLVWLAVIAVLNSVAAAYYYLRLIVYMYMRDPEGEELRLALTPAAGVALALTVWGTLSSPSPSGPSPRSCRKRRLVCPATSSSAPRVCPSRSVTTRTPCGSGTRSTSPARRASTATASWSAPATSSPRPGRCSTT
jgi:NADH-quinone oxidoreductase subunit N